LTTFIEVDSLDKNCKVIINLDSVREIAPLVSGGCDIFFNGDTGTGTINKMRVKDPYSQFQQFAMQTVSAADIKKKVEKLRGTTPVDIVKVE